MTIQQFQILFDKPNTLKYLDKPFYTTGTYYPGEMVTGKVMAKILLPTRIRGIELNFHGEAKVEWEETKHHRDPERNIPHSASELYFENSFYIVGGPACDMLLEAGDHTYDFSKKLPSILPSSFKGRYGSICYSLQASLICVEQNDHHAKVDFIIANELDLNHVEGVREPVRVEKDKYLYCFCCKSGPITAVVSLPASGFARFQRIPITVEVDNATNKTLSSVTCFLQKVEVYTAVRPNKEIRVDTEKFSQLVLGGVKPYASRTWQENIIVASWLPSVLHRCTIIDISYSLVVEVTVPGLHRNLSVSVPITVGTVPLRSNGPRDNYFFSLLPPLGNLSLLPSISRPDSRSPDVWNASASLALMPR